MRRRRGARHPSSPTDSQDQPPARQEGHRREEGGGGAEPRESSRSTSALGGHPARRRRIHRLRVLPAQLGAEDGSRSEQARLEAEKARLQNIFKKRDELQKKREDLDRKIGIIKDLKSKQGGPVRLLDEIPRNLPDYVWFSTVSESQPGDVIDGFALNANKVADFVDNLKRIRPLHHRGRPPYDTAQGQVTFHSTTQFVVEVPVPGAAAAPATTRRTGAR